MSSHNKDYAKVVTKPTDQFPSDEWVLHVFEGWFDPCPLNETPEVDGLSIEWPDCTYVNPPYSDPLPWVRKAISTAGRGKRVVMLLKMDTSTQWFAELKQAGAKFAWLSSRLKYGSGCAAPFPSMLAFLTEKPKNRSLL